MNLKTFSITTCNPVFPKWVHQLNYIFIVSQLPMKNTITGITALGAGRGQTWEASGFFTDCFVKQCLNLFI